MRHPYLFATAAFSAEPSSLLPLRAVELPLASVYFFILVVFLSLNRSIGDSLFTTCISQAILNSDR